MKKKKENIIIAITTIINLVGFLGIINPVYRSFFLIFTPLNLILTSVCFFYLNKDLTYRLFIISIFIFSFGFFIEVLGVYSGKLFGAYRYGDTLGYKILDVPIVIGINWLFLSLSTFGISNFFLKNSLLKIVSASFLMVLLDYFVEPIAVLLDFWQWEDNSIPVQNYYMWFLTSLTIHSLICYLKLNIRIKAALFIYLLQVVFFVLLNIFIL